MWDISKRAHRSHVNNNFIPRKIPFICFDSKNFDSFWHVVSSRYLDEFSTSRPHEYKNTMHTIKNANRCNLLFHSSDEKLSISAKSKNELPFLTEDNKVSSSKIHTLNQQKI